MIVNMPDGKKVTFPDDIERSKVRDFINKKYPDAFKSLNIDTSKLSGTDVMNSDGLNSSPMQKLDTMLTFAGMLTKGNKKLESLSPAITAARAITNTDYSKLGSEALKSLGRQTTELTAGSTGFYVKNAGRLLHDDYFTEEDFNKEQPFNTAYAIWKANQTVSDILTNFGKSIEDLSDKVQNSDILKGDEQLFEGSFEENPNLHKVIDLSMSGASSLVGAYTVSKVANPTVAMYFMSGADAKDVLEESLEAGKSKAESFGLWTAATIGTAKLEKFGFEKVFGVKITKNGMQAIVDSSKKTSEKILEGILSEGAEEGLQTVWQNTVAKIGYDESRDIFQNALESAIGGALGGGLVSSFNYGIQSFKKKSADAGLSEQEQDNIVNAIGQAVADNPSLVDVPFQENMKKTYESFSKMIEEMGDTPERQRLIATKNALDTGYNKYYEEFKNYMPEEQAKANASLLRSSALFFSDLDGITVDEWFKTKAPQIKRFGDVSKQAKEFVDNVTPTKLTLDEEEVNLFEALKNPELIKQYQEKDTRESLLRFIKKQGGAKDVGGDLKAMDLGKQVIGVINNKSGNSLDDLALSAWERGYFPEFTERPTVNDLLDAMREESFGKKRYAGEKKQGIEDYVNTLAENLNRMGIDYKDMTPAEIEQVYNQRMAEEQENIQSDTTPTESFAFADNEFFQVADENARLDDIYPEYKGETITINGKERTVYNSNGDRIAKSKEALENFYKWFGDSKVVDEQGRPKVMYHGTPNAIYDTLRAGTYFTDNKAYAEVYKSQGASSISYKKEAAKPDVYAVYIKMEKPFDTRNKEARDDFYKYYYQQMGMGTDLQESGLPDWNDGRDLLEFITEYHPELGYDGILLDEGGVGGYGEDVKSRGISYVNISPNQIKSISNRGTYSESENIYYQTSNENIYGATNSNEEPIANPENFNIFIAGSRVTDNDEPVSPENPPKKIYRGDTRYFEEYEPQENAYEYDWGKGFYLSDNYDDVAANYQSGGADLTNRIEREAEQLAQDEDIDYDEAKEKIKEKYEQGDIIREFYLSMKEPVIIGGEKETFFDYTEEYNEETDEYEEPQGKLIDMIYEIENYLADIGADEYTQAITSRLYEAAIENGGLSASQIEDVVRGTEEANYLIDYESTAGEMLSSVWGSIGFDGIIDHRAGTKFKNMNMDEDTTHYVVFNSEQAKSVDNKGQWGVTNKNFYYQSAFAGSRVDYDRPSLEAIGSGEGNQAHGWGLYYALNKDVAEDYRKRFVGIENRGKAKIINKKTNEEITSENDFDTHYALTRIANFHRDLNKGKKEYIKFLEDELENNKDDSFVQEETSKILETVKKLSVDDYKVEGLNYGQVHEVDIPENPYLLDEDRTISGQSKYVKDILKSIPENLAKDKSQLASETYESLLAQKKKENASNKMYGLFGEDYYKVLSETLGSDKAASQYLEKLGIKGITYDGRQDGRCFVIFNPDDVKVIQKFYQNEQAPLGAYVNRVIYLNETANASTLPHELAHFWSDELKRSKSLRAKEILRQADVWENREFERKYSVAKQGDVFAVTDKDGKTVYDKMGEGFATEEQAKAYAKEELFARGFEKYIKEGKAPNKTLKQAFRNFYNWLKKIYVDMLSLDIKLSPNMRNLYADILGGTSIDTFLDSEIDEFIDKRTQAEEDKSKQVQGIIEQAQANDVSTMPDKIRKAWRESDWGDIWKKIAIPLSTRAKRISPRLRTKIRQFEFDVMDTKQNYYREAESMLKKWNNFSKEDRIAFDLALKNSTTDIRDEILKKYNATEDFAKVQKVLEDIYEQALNAGLEVGYLEDYFPRKVIDKNGLMTYLHNTEEWSGFQQALQREDPRGEFSAEEQAEFIDKYLRGIVRADLASYKYSSEKQRKLDIIDNNINQYYADSMQALLSYIDGMNARIQTSNFFGRNRQNIDESIGEFIAYMLNNGEIKPSQIDEVKNILTAVFKRRGVSSKGIKFARDISYIYTMGGINTAITQLDDWFVAAYKGGAINTFKAVFSKDVVTKKDLGLDSIAAEFMEGTGTAKAVNWVFKHNGIELIDGFGKNALLNGTLRRLQTMSDAELREYVEPIMEERTDSTIADIRNGNLSKDVRFFLFNELSDMQPVSLSELPELYNVGGNARIFYMLKSFMLKRIDTIRNECYDKIRSNDKSERLKGWQNLYKLAFLMMLGGATKDLIIDLMYRRVVDISDMMVNNLLGIIGISKYNIYQVREEGMGHTLAIFATPPLWQVLEDLSGDVSKYISGERQLKDFEVFKGLPMVGRFYYWWIGGGHTKTEKRKKKKGS